MQRPLKFSRNEAKEAQNLLKHSISLDCASDFDFETSLTGVDTRHDYGEIREIGLGFIGERLHVLVFTMRGEICHVISLRKANRREIRRYIDGIDEED